MKIGLQPTFLGVILARRAPAATAYFVDSLGAFPPLAEAIIKGVLLPPTFGSCRHLSKFATSDHALQGMRENYTDYTAPSTATASPRP